jgi:hypothetical protein
MLRRNGLERTAKSFVRYWVSDRRYWADVATAVGLPGGRDVVPDPSRLAVGDASDPAVWNRWADGSIDLLVSEDVFEHIPGADIPAVLANMHRKMVPGGIALIRLNVFRGITGGHLVERYEEFVDDPSPKAQTPWVHLRDGGPTGNTFLNRNPRSQYRRHVRRAF